MSLPYISQSNEKFSFSETDFRKYSEELCISIRKSWIEIDNSRYWWFFSRVLYIFNVKKDFSSQKHAYIILTPLNPTFM